MENPAVQLSQKALLFIPDISGFTNFIGDRDFQHGQHIIAELLEVLIDANQLDLQVNEVEGDAVFFYRVGKAPGMKDLIEQTEKMYVAFHTHLKKYGVSRLCNCATCQSAARLTLKFFIHFGDVSFHKVKNHEKLLGTDVILIHRLMKNNISEEEYMLMTDQIQVESDEILQWQSGSNLYDLGEIKFSYASLSKWYEKVPEPEIPEMIIHRSKNPLVHAIEIDSTIDVIYDSLIDLNQRKHYMVGINSIEIKSQEFNRLNRICTSFKCSMEHEKCSFETSGVEFEENKLTFNETLKEQPMTLDYVLEKNSGKTKVSIIVHPALKFPMSWMFNLIMKRKFSSDINQSLRQLKIYCEQKVLN